MNWSTHQTNGIVYHQFGLATPIEFGENSNGRSIYGQAYHGMLSDDKVTYQTGNDATLRTWFNNTGALNNTQDTNFRSISPDWPVMALSKDLGDISSESPPVTFTLGLVRDPAISYQTESGPQSRSLFFRTQLGSDVDAVSRALINECISFLKLYSSPFSSRTIATLSLHATRLIIKSPLQRPKFPVNMMTWLFWQPFKRFRMPK